MTLTWDAQIPSPISHPQPLPTLLPVLLPWVNPCPLCDSEIQLNSNLSRWYGGYAGECILIAIILPILLDFYF